LQRAICIYLNQNELYANYIHQLRTKLITGFTMLSDCLKELGFTIPVIDGGYFIRAQLPKPWTDGFRFAIDLYEQEKIAVIPGIHFSDKGSSFIRFNIAREKTEIQEAIEGLRHFFLL
jgi:aspartate/methionine/tyrosine aminotransferase